MGTTMNIEYHVVWHPRASPPSQVTYGLGVGATTIVDAGEAGVTELAGAVSPGREGDAGPFRGDASTGARRRAIASPGTSR